MGTTAISGVSDADPNDILDSEDIEIHLTVESEAEEEVVIVEQTQKMQAFLQSWDRTERMFAQIQQYQVALEAYGLSKPLALLMEMDPEQIDIETLPDIGDPQSEETQTAMESIKSVASKVWVWLKEMARNLMNMVKRLSAFIGRLFGRYESRIKALTAALRKNVAYDMEKMNKIRKRIFPKKYWVSICSDISGKASTLTQLKTINFLKWSDAEERKLNAIHAQWDKVDKTMHDLDWPPSERSSLQSAGWGIGEIKDTSALAEKLAHQYNQTMPDLMNYLNKQINLLYREIDAESHKTKVDPEQLEELKSGLKYVRSVLQWCNKKNKDISLWLQCWILPARLIVSCQQK